MSKQPFILAMAMLFIVVQTALTQTPIQQGSGPEGIVSVEAEHYDAIVEQGGHTWELATDTAGFVGEGYMTSLPNTGINNDTGYMETSPRLDFEVMFVKTGIHYVWVLGWGDSDADDSCHTGLDGVGTDSSYRFWGFGTSWLWNNTSDVANPRRVVDVATLGLHTVNIWMREDGFKCDKIVLTTDENFTPAGDGPPESLRSSENATNIGPNDGATDVPPNSALAWDPGEFAATHHVYFGTSFDDVNSASVGDPRGVLASEGQSATAFDPGRLDFGQTYFWRVDEVNAAPDFSVFQGNVWSFQVEPFSVPISNITVTASSEFGESPAERTIDGSGLVDDLHGISTSDMWISDSLPATIEYAFDRAYKLHELWIWNSNQLVEGFLGFGAKDVVIETSLDGSNWTVLEGVGPLAQAPGTDGYAHNSTIDFGGATASHVRMTINAVHGFVQQASLSEVRFLHIPTFATGPSPASGASDVFPDVTLAWGRSGREADHHDVYVGSNPDDLALAGSVGENSFDTSAADLQLSQTYYWRVDEVNDAMEPSTWTGDVWSFTTADAIFIDDMESYKDVEFLEIWATWIDGFGDEANNGALVGANPGVGDFSPESTIVHGDSQSLPIHYDNGGAAQSEATRTFAVAQDWTRAGVTHLVVWFHGTAGNTGQLYLKINGTKIPYEGPAGNIALAAWQAWSLDLASLGMNLQSVRSLAVGIEGNGVRGTLYVDDIALEQSAPEAINEWRVSASSDDAEEHILDGGVMEGLTSSDLELGYEGDMAPANLQTIGCRWVGIAVPRAATITEAWVQFSADSVGSANHALPVSLVIQGQLSPNPETFAGTASSISGRATTAANVVWDIPEWLTVHAMGPEERTPDISSIIQEIVNQPGWSGEAIVLMFADNPANPSSGSRESESFDGGASDAPLLHISFE